MTAGDAKTESQRRARVVHGWAFENLTVEQEAEVEAYLEGGPVPERYARVDVVVR